MRVLRLEASPHTLETLRRLVDVSSPATTHPTLLRTALERGAEALERGLWPRGVLADVSRHGSGRVAVRVPEQLHTRLAALLRVAPPRHTRRGQQRASSISQVGEAALVLGFAMLEVEEDAVSNSVSTADEAIIAHGGFNSNGTTGETTDGLFSPSRCAV